MEHPLIGPLDELTLEQLSAKVNELSKKLSIATRSGNGHLCNQLRMAIESYNTKYQEKLREEQNKNFDDKINIQ